jgi:hypothetical protein
VNKLWNKKIYLCGSHITQVYTYGKIQNGYSISNPNIKSKDSLPVVGDSSVFDISNTEEENQVLLALGYAPKLSREEQLIKIDLKIKEFEKKPVREIDKEIKRDKNNRSNAINKRNKLIRLINSNPQLTTFVTLTFKENVQDFKYCAECFDTMRRLINKDMKIRGDKFEYVSVIEFQQRGAIHYHMLCNLSIPFVTVRDDRRKSEEQKNYENLFSLSYWEYGFVGIQPLTPNPKYGDSVDNVGAYLVKYMTKEIDNPTVKNQKMFRCSQGLIKPIEIKFLDLGSDSLILGDVKFSNSYTSDFTGKVVFEEFNSKRKSV